MNTSIDNINQVIDVGDVEAEKLLLITQSQTIDIQEFVLQTTIFEDIFSNIMTGALVIRDSANLINTYKLRGQEQVILRFKTPGFTSAIEKTFFISSIKGRILGEKDQIYVLHLTSLEGAIDNVTKVTKKIKGKTDVVIANLFNTYLKQDKNLISYATHNTNIALVSPFWTPLKIINWICNRSFENAPNIVFYEGNKNFYLTSLEKLYQQESYGQYQYIPTANTTEWSLSERFYLINGISDIPHLDVFNAQDHGYYASKLITHDITLKQYKEFQHDHFSYKEETEGLDDYPIFPENIVKNSETYRSVRTKQYAMFPEKEDPQYETWAMKRNSLMYEANNLKFVITVPGKTDIEVGKVIDVLIPRSVAKDMTTGNQIENLFDPYLSGRYLITGIRHQFTLNKHEMYLEIMKETFQEPVE